MKCFRRTASRCTLFDHKKNEEILKELKVEPVDSKLRRYKSDWLRYVTIMNSSSLAKTMLNFRPGGRTGLRRPLKRLSDDAETSLSRPNWRRLMMMMMMMMMMTTTTTTTTMVICNASAQLRCTCTPEVSCAGLP